ncbi:hypothetical protein LZK76_08155 [Rhizobium leguminosarum]|nr:hypothetical protein LZK76_08155 [Rhizobium leguminosarum]
MRIAIFTLMRLGPSLTYATASIFVLSIPLLESHASSAFAWWLYMTILPVMREPIYLLLAIPGVGIWSATVLLMLASIFGIRVAMQPQRHRRSGFIHAHIALIATGLTMVREPLRKPAFRSLRCLNFNGATGRSCRYPNRLGPSFSYPCFWPASAAI